MANWIDRQRNLLDFTLSSLLRRKMKNASLITVYTLVVFMAASVVFFTHAIKKEAAIILKKSPEMIVQRMVAGRHQSIPVSYLEGIDQIRGVSSAHGRLWGYYYDPVNGANYTLMVPERFEYGPGSIVIGAGISRSRLVYPGDEMEFMDVDSAILNLQVQKIFSTDSELVTSDLMLISRQDFTRLFGTPTAYATDLAVRVRNQRELSTIAEKIAAKYPDTRIILREEILRTYDSIFNWRGGMMIFFLVSTLLAFMIFAWDRASGLSQEEKKEIGILKAIGWETADVLRIKFFEGLVISLSAFLAGIILAYGHVFFTNSIVFEPALKGWAVLYPTFKLTPFIDPLQVATLFFLTVVPYTVVTIIPSWKAATIDPDTVMRA